MSITSRVSGILGAQFDTQQGIMQTNRDSYATAVAEFAVAKAELRSIVVDLGELESTLEAAGRLGLPAELVISH